MAHSPTATAGKIISKNIRRSSDTAVVSNVKCVRLYRGRHGFGLTFEYCFSYVMNIAMDEVENVSIRDLEYDRDNATDSDASDADISSECSDTSCTHEPHNSSKTIKKVFVKWVTPGSPADQAGLLQGDEVVNLNNSAVYGKRTSDIENLVKNSAAIDVDVLDRNVRRRNKVTPQPDVPKSMFQNQFISSRAVHDTKPTDAVIAKEKLFRGLKWNACEACHSHQEEGSDNVSSLSWTSCSSDNGASPSSLSPPAEAADRYFVLTCEKLDKSEAMDQGPRLAQMQNSFPPFLPSYSDEEPVMESKPVGLSLREVEADLVDVRKTKSSIPRSRTRLSSREAQVVFDDDEPVFEDETFRRSHGLTSSTSSSVLVESADIGSKSSQPPCVTVTTATYSTLASPQTTLEENVFKIDEKAMSDSYDNNTLVIPLTNGDVWERGTSRHVRRRSRSPSPAQRRVSYLMATEGSASLTSGNWIVKSNMDEETGNGLQPVEDEPGDISSKVTCFYQRGSGAQSGDQADSRDVGTPREQFVIAKLASSEPVVVKASESVDESEVGVTDAQSEIPTEEKRQSLKRKCSVEIVVEVEKEGYLLRKIDASHGRRPWKQVYVILKAHVLYIYKDKPDEMVNSGQEEKPISIKSCIVDIAYDYRKRENVFRLTTYNCSQYLFQAKDKESMMSWIGAIQKNNNPDEDKSGVTSENLIVRRKKNMDHEISTQPASKQMPPTTPLKISGLKKSLSFKSNSGSQSSFRNNKKAIDGESGKATWHNKVVNKMKKIGSTSAPIPLYQLPGYSVGVPLDRCTMSKNNPLLPLLVEHCCQVVESKGLESVGIYRVPGNSANVAALEEELNAKTSETIDFEDQKWNDPNNMGSLLKKFLCKLPEGLVTSELYCNFIEANRKEGEERMWALKHLVHQLPGTYAETLTFLIKHLKKVSKHSDKNKMEIRNLAIVFGPTIVRTGQDNMMTMVNDMSDKFRIVESFITHRLLPSISHASSCHLDYIMSVAFSFDWFFDNELVANGTNHPMALSPPPPVEEFSQLLVSSKMMNSIGQAAISFESSDSNWKFKSPSIKLPNFKGFIKHSSDSSRKTELSPDQGGSPEPGDCGKGSPVNLFPYDHGGRLGGGSQPSSPTAGRRKFIKRHHSSTNISTMEVPDDFHRSKSEGEDEDSSFHPRPNYATKAYSYARPPPPSYLESKNKGSFRGQSQSSPPAHQLSNRGPLNTSPDSGETRDFNTLSEDTKRRLLSLSLKNKVNEKMKQKSAEETLVSSQNMAQNTFVEDSPKSVVTTAAVPQNVSENRKLSTSSTSVSCVTDDQTVVTEPQMKPSEVKRRFESLSQDQQKPAQARVLTSNPTPQLRKRDGPVSSSSSRNFKIYSNAEVNFSQYRPNQINEWVQELGKEDGFNVGVKSHGEGERGRSRNKKDDGVKGMRRSASVSRTSFIQDDEETVLNRRSLSCQDINLSDDMFNRTSTTSKSSDSSDSSDEEDLSDVSSPSFGEKLHGLMQKNKLENKSNSEIQQPRRFSQVSHPPNHRVSRTSVEKMRAMDPSSKIQSGAVSSMKFLFESGTPHQNVVKSRSSSLSSNSSGSILSTDSQRKKSTCSSTLSETEVKRRVWESDSSSPGERRMQYKEPVWVAKERAMKNLKSESESSLKATSDDNNNSVPNDLSNGVVCARQYKQSKSLPVTQTGSSLSEMTLGPGEMGNRKTEMADGKIILDNTSVGSTSLECSNSQGAVFKSPPTVQKVRSTNTSVPKKVVHSVKTNFVGSEALENTKPGTRPRRRILSDTSHRASPGARHPSAGRTFTAPVLGTVVTTTTAVELSGFAIKPDCRNRNPRARDQRQTEKHDSGKPFKAFHTKESLNVPRDPCPKDYGSPSFRRKTRLTVPEVDDSKRLSTDRSILEQNALHIKELLDEMNTEHSLKMERQKSDTISLNAQKSARNRARQRRLSLGQEKGNGVVVASRLSPSGVISERGRNDTNAPLSPSKADLQRNISTVKWVGVSS